MRKNTEELKNIIKAKNKKIRDLEKDNRNLGQIVAEIEEKVSDAEDDNKKIFELDDHLGEVQAKLKKAERELTKAKKRNKIFACLT